MSFKASSEILICLGPHNSACLVLGIDNILNPCKLLPHTEVPSSCGDDTSNPRVKRLIKEENCNAVVLLTGPGIVSVSDVVCKSLIIWSLPLPL